MSVSTEVQRTLVKSPPELWAELGSVEGLARQLGEVGEIRVVELEPESRVEWEADLASGVVELEQSGWGTKVTLSLTRELPEPESEVPGKAKAVLEQEENQIADTKPSDSGEPELAVDAAAVAEPEPAREPEPVKSEPEPIASAPEPVASAPDPIASAPEPIASAPERVASAPDPGPVPAGTVEPKQGLFARLFKRRKATEAQTEPEPVAITQPEPPIELHAMAWPEPVYPEPPPKPVEPGPDLAAELAELEAQLQQESTELLTRVLDRLGAAHHRPFSRA